MEPTPETLEALRILSDRGDNAVSAALADLGRAASRIVPELVGLSLGLTEGGLTFTLIASSSDIAALDAVQYVEGGPCLEAMRTGQTVETDASGLMDEDRWQAFAQAEAAAGVASTLSMPIMREGRAVGGINLYASTADAFEGHHDELAAALGATAGEAVTNADLGFRSRATAAEAPTRIHERDLISTAAGYLASAHDIDIEAAEQLLRQAAQRAGVTEAQTATVFLQLARRRNA